MNKNNRPVTLKDIFNFIVENIFDIITIGASLFVIVRNQFYPYYLEDIPNLITWLLSILGLLAISELWERHRRIRKIENSTAQTLELVAKKLGEQTRAADFFSKNDKLIGDLNIERAKNIYVVGMILNRAVRDNLSVFSKRITDNANLRFIVLDYQDETLMQIMPLRSYGHRKSDWWKSRIQQTVDHIEDIPDTEINRGSLEIGFLPYFPSFGMWLIDPDDNDGQIVVEIYHHNTSELNPTFKILKADDSYWYQFFRNQYDIMWNACKEKGRVQIVAPTKI